MAHISTETLKRACEDGSFSHDMALAVAAERDSLKRALETVIHEQGRQFKLREAAEAELGKAQAEYLLKAQQYGVRIATLEKQVYARTVRHVRVGIAKAGKRINAARGNPGRTMCGAEITVNDVAFSDWNKMNEADVKEWNICHECHFGSGVVCDRCHTEPCECRNERPEETTIGATKIHGHSPHFKTNGGAVCKRCGIDEAQFTRAKCHE